MRRYRKLLIFLGLFLLIAAVAGAVAYHLIRQPAKAVYLLPDGNLMAHVNFTPFHYMDLGSKTYTSNPQYQDFVEQTGFHFEHDLDSVTLAQSSPGDVNGEVSAIFIGTFDQDRLNRYVQKQPVETETYGGKTVFSIREGTQTVRVSILDSKTVALTTGASTAAMHSIIDKLSGSALTPSLLLDYYGDVPFGSVAWAIVRVPGNPELRQPMGQMNLDFLQNSVTIVSVRYSGSVRFRAEFISANQADATHVFQAVNGFVALARSAQGDRNTDKDVAALIDGIQLQQNGNRVVLNLVVTQDLIKKMTAKQ